MFQSKCVAFLFVWAEVGTKQTGGRAPLQLNRLPKESLGNLGARRVLIDMADRTKHRLFREWTVAW